MEEAIHHVPCPYRVSRCGEGVSGVQTQSSQSGIAEEDALILKAGAESRMQGGTKNSKWIVELVTTGWTRESKGGSDAGSKAGRLAGSTITRRLALC
jgi:hypothetical protein